MKLIAAVDKQWAIGKNGELLAHIPEDLKFFRQKTTGNIIILGRKTLETFPGKKPLPNRTNIILSRNLEFQVEGGIVVHSMEELLEVLKGYDDDSIYVIGGERVYRQLLPLCDEAFITYIACTYEADAYLENLEGLKEWRLEEQSEVFQHGDISYCFRTYRRIWN